MISIKRLLLNTDWRKQLPVACAWLMTFALYLAIFIYFALSARWSRFITVAVNEYLYVILLAGYFFINHAFIARYIRHGMLFLLEISLALVVLVLLLIN